MKTYEEYLENLKDGREVYYRGEKVEDITTHPILNYTPVFLGRIHHGHLLSEEEKRRFFFRHPETGTMLSNFYKIPRSTQDLIDRFQTTWDFTMNSLVNIAHIGSDMILAMMVASSQMGGEYSKRMDAFCLPFVSTYPYCPSITPPLFLLQSPEKFRYSSLFRTASSEPDLVHSLFYSRIFLN